MKIIEGVGQPYIFTQCPSPSSQFNYQRLFGFPPPLAVHPLISPSPMGFLSYCLCRRFHKAPPESAVGDGDFWQLFFQVFPALKVAVDFSYQLDQFGSGGFGMVYKGLMPNGQEVAVKKLSVDLRHELGEAMNEVKVLSQVQHTNLVTLLGRCVEGIDKMLVYEYLPNKSLDYFLFDKTKSPSLDWSKRFQIIFGIARGLFYLHEEAPEIIIHGDIKASNILLDEQFNPKISNFTSARLYPCGQTHLNTSMISGTRGYIAPEYAIHGHMSVKADVFSFGVLVLEIVSGRKNLDEQLGGEKADLLNYTWTLFQGGKALELIDPSLGGFNSDEAAVCIQLGLLCCQESVVDRLNMKSVYLMLSSGSFDLPRPGKPGWINSTTPTSTADNDYTNVGIEEFSEC